MTYTRVSAAKRSTYERLLYVLGNLSQADYLANTTNSDSVANEYKCSPIVIPKRCRIDKIGIYVGGGAVSGNLILAVHASKNDLPTTKVCQTAPTAVGGLQATAVNWLAVINPPIVEAGLYFVGWICSENYVAATSGIRVYEADVHTFAGAEDWSDGIYGIYSENVGGFSVPSPMTPVADGDRWLYEMVLKVTVI